MPTNIISKTKAYKTFQTVCFPLTNLQAFTAATQITTAVAIFCMIVAAVANAATFTKEKIIANKYINATTQRA